MDTSDGKRGDSSNGVGERTKCEGVGESDSGAMADASGAPMAAPATPTMLVPAERKRSEAALVTVEVAPHDTPQQIQDSHKTETETYVFALFVFFFLQTTKKSKAGKSTASRRRRCLQILIWLFLKIRRYEHIGGPLCGSIFRQNLHEI